MVKVVVVETIQSQNPPLLVTTDFVRIFKEMCVSSLWITFVIKTSGKMFFYVWVYQNETDWVI